MHRLESCMLAESTPCRCCVRTPCRAHQEVCRLKVRLGGGFSAVPAYNPKALSDRSHPQPRVINADLAPIYSSAIADGKKDGTLRKRCRHRPVQYLNNILEQDHRAIKRRIKAKQGFREFQAARRTIQGYEAVHMIRKGQVRWLAGDNLLPQIRFIDRLFDLAT
jgi:hypothetical protein